jgi:ferredoxin
MHTDGLAYVKEHSWPSIMGPSGGTEPVYKMAEGMALILDSEIESVIESAEECPGECIFIEPV